MKAVFHFLIVVMTMISFRTASAQSPANADAPALSLNHIAVYVYDLQKSTTIYDNVLGLKQRPEAFHDGKHIWCTIGAAGSPHLIHRAAANIAPDKNDHLCLSGKSIDELIANV